MVRSHDVHLSPGMTNLGEREKRLHFINYPLLSTITHPRVRRDALFLLPSRQNPIELHHTSLLLYRTDFSRVSLYSLFSHGSYSFFLVLSSPLNCSNILDVLFTLPSLSLSDCCNSLYKCWRHWRLCRSREDDRSIKRRRDQILTSTGER